MPELIEHPVVEQDVRAVQPRDDHVLVVTRIAKQRAVGAIPVRHARNILLHAAGSDPELRVDGSILVLHVQIGPQPRPVPEHRV
jgi:hypothetical protein